jgi:enterochelin esterase family protein
MRLRSFFINVVVVVVLASAVLGQAGPDDKYVLGADSQVRPGVPEGRVVQFDHLVSKVFAGLDHTWWLYIPPGYDKKKALPIMVFQDGYIYAARDGRWRVPVVLNNLIAKKEIPAMAAVFINPGTGYMQGPDGSPMTSAAGIRLDEYLAMNDQYARFLIEDVFPEVRKYVRITDDPEGRAIAGWSAGGFCAFNAAWLRADQFRKVFSNNGTLQMGAPDSYPVKVKTAERKPIRVWHQTGEADNPGPLTSNKAIAEAFKEKGYDTQFVLGTGSHSDRHAASIFPDAMRWLWRNYSIEGK